MYIITTERINLYKGQTQALGKNRQIGRTTNLRPAAQCSLVTQRNNTVTHPPCREKKSLSYPNFAFSDQTALAQSGHRMPSSLFYASILSILDCSCAKTGLSMRRLETLFSGTLQQWHIQRQCETYAEIPEKIIIHIYLLFLLDVLHKNKLYLHKTKIILLNAQKGLQYLTRINFQI